MLITADQLVCHAIGDYLLQSHWMASRKTKSSLAALCHVFTYMLPFFFLRPSFAALAVVVGTHFVIDRWRLARFVVLAKNVCFDFRHKVEERDTDFDLNTGYPLNVPPWLATWLLIIADNILHVVINGLALKYL